MDQCSRQSWGQFNSGIGVDYFFNGIDKFGIEVCYKKLNPQINLPFYFLIQKYSFMTILLGI